MTSRRIGTIALACVCATGIYIAGLSAAPPVAAPVTADRSIDQIAAERLTVLNRGFEMARLNFEKGFSDRRMLDEWTWRRASAARDLADPRQRVAILQESLEQLQKGVTFAEQTTKIGAAAPDHLLNAKDRALECELWLAKARAAQ